MIRVIITQHSYRKLFLSANHISRNFSIGCIQLSSLTQQFEEAKLRLNSLSDDPGNEVKLKLYGLFKQGIEGPVKTERPGFTDFVGRAKWDAWNVNKDLTQEAAQQKYIDLINSLVKSEVEDASARQQTGKKYNTILVEIDGGLRKIILNRPKKMNATSFELMREWTEALKEADNDPKTVITAITGAGSYFSAGNDFLSNYEALAPDQLATISEENRRTFYNFATAVIDFRKPLVAVINGPAFGIGATILALCDGVYATDRAVFSTPFSSVGLAPEFCSSETFPRLIGYGKATQMLSFNKKITAAEACRLDLVTEVFPDATFQSEIWLRLKEFSKLPPKCLFYAKDLMREREREYFHKVASTEWVKVFEGWEGEDCANFVRNFQSKK